MKEKLLRIKDDALYEKLVKKASDEQSSINYIILTAIREYLKKKS